MCEETNEDLKHFILQCPAYDKERKENCYFVQNDTETPEDVIGNLLFNNEVKYKTKETLYKFWKIREKRRKELSIT